MIMGNADAATGVTDDRAIGFSTRNPELPPEIGPHLKENPPLK
jgi:hypothetical protein